MGSALLRRFLVAIALAAPLVVVGCTTTGELQEDRSGMSPWDALEGTFEATREYSCDSSQPVMPETWRMAVSIDAERRGRAEIKAWNATYFEPLELNATYPALKTTTFFVDEGGDKHEWGVEWDNRNKTEAGLYRLGGKQDQTGCGFINMHEWHTLRRVGEGTSL